VAVVVDQASAHNLLGQMVVLVVVERQTAHRRVAQEIRHQPLHHRGIMVRQDLIVDLHTIQAVAVVEPQQQGLLQLPQLQQMVVLV
jgi:hypothetical protein